VGIFTFRKPLRRKKTRTKQPTSRTTGGPAPLRVEFGLAPSRLVARGPGRWKWSEGRRLSSLGTSSSSPFPAGLLGRPCRIASGTRSSPIWKASFRSTRVSRSQPGGNGPTGKDWVMASHLRPWKKTDRPGAGKRGAGPGARPPAGGQAAQDKLDGAGPASGGSATCSRTGRT